MQRPDSAIKPAIKGRGPAREIALVLAAKLLALGLIYFLFFSPSQRPDVGAEQVLDALTGPPAASSLSSGVRP